MESWGRKAALEEQMRRVKKMALRIGPFVGALVVGIARATAVHMLPEVELFVIYATMALVLTFRPEGLFAPAKARKI